MGVSTLEANWDICILALYSLAMTVIWFKNMIDAP